MRVLQRLTRVLKICFLLLRIILVNLFSSCAKEEEGGLVDVMSHFVGFIPARFWYGSHGELLKGERRKYTATILYVWRRIAVWNYTISPGNGVLVFAHCYGVQDGNIWLLA